jgi:hypothetical protein
VMVLGCENIGGCDMVQKEHFYTTEGVLAPEQYHVTMAQY